tara:strand:- start:14488 stop:15201 length:714 start_codon:yes stop_codon:yes gene_type:complete
MNVIRLVPRFPALLALVLNLLAGCVTAAPAPERPAAETPALVTAVTLDQLEALAAAGLSEATVLAFLDGRPLAFDGLEQGVRARLRRAGSSDQVLAALERPLPGSEAEGGAELIAERADAVARVAVYPAYYYGSRYAGHHGLASAGSPGHWYLDRYEGALGGGHWAGVRGHHPPGYQHGLQRLHDSVDGHWTGFGVHHPLPELGGGHTSPARHPGGGHGFRGHGLSHGTGRGLGSHH